MIIRQIIIATLLLAALTHANAQSSYHIETPDGFSRRTSTGRNVDLVIGDSYGASVTVVKMTLPAELAFYSIWDMLGDLDSYMYEWESGASEHMDYPKVVKYGQTTVNGKEAFWYDHTLGNPPDFFSKTYQVKVGSIAYTFTFGCPYAKKDSYSALWFRLKDSIRFDIK
jgi:hypothetical protein